MSKTKTKSKRNLKVVVITCLIIGVIFALGGWYWLNKDNADLKNDAKGLNVIVSEWNGWSKEQPPKRKYSYKITNGDIIRLDGGTEAQYNFKVISIDKQIEIELPDNIVEEEKGGGINIFDRNNDETIVISLDGTKTRVCSQTMDMGTCFEFYYIK